MWFYYSLFFALWSAVGTFIIKKSSSKIKPLPLLFVLALFSAPLIFIFILITSGVPLVTNNFYIYMGVAGILDAVAFIAYFNAISKSQISLLAPISAFTPIVTTIIAFFALRETPSVIKFFGIILIVMGAYLLNVSEIKVGLFAPFKKLFEDKGVLLSLFANLIWGITPIFQKKAIFETHPQIPLYASFIGEVVLIIFLFPLAFKQTLSYLPEVKRGAKTFTVFGIGTALSQYAGYAAFATSFVGYSTAVFKLSALFIIIAGGLFLKEKNIGERLIGASVMLIGTLILAL